MDKIFPKSYLNEALKILIFNTAFSVRVLVLFGGKSMKTGQKRGFLWIFQHRFLVRKHKTTLTEQQFNVMGCSVSAHRALWLKVDTKFFEKELGFNSYYIMVLQKYGFFCPYDLAMTRHLQNYESFLPKLHHSHRKYGQIIGAHTSSYQEY